MSGITVSIPEASEAMHILATADRPLRAIRIAERMHLPGSHETRRRKVRAIIEHLRREGEWIVASGDGYALTTDRETWRDYQQGRQVDAKRILAEVSTRKKAIVDPSGQCLLFKVGDRA